MFAERLFVYSVELADTMFCCDSPDGSGVVRDGGGVTTGHVGTLARPALLCSRDSPLDVGASVTRAQSSSVGISAGRRVWRREGAEPAAGPRDAVTTA